MRKFALAVLFISPLFTAAFSPSPIPGVAEVRITFEKVDVIIGAYDRVRYKVTVEALDEDGERVDVPTYGLVFLQSDGEILWLGGKEWFDFGRGGGGFVRLEGISDGFLWSSTVKLRVVGFADDKVATDAVIVFP